MNFAFHPQARAEYVDAAAFYESRRPGLGAAFTFEVESTIARIVDSPKAFREIEQDVRRCLTHIFPYGIHYTIEQEYILILAVAHASREPGYWRNRV